MMDFSESNFEEAFVEDYVQQHGNQVTAIKTEYYEVSEQKLDNLSTFDKLKARTKEFFSPRKRKLGEHIRKTGNLSNDQVRKIARKKYSNMTTKQKMDVAEKWSREGKNVRIVNDYMVHMADKLDKQFGESENEERADKFLGRTTDREKTAMAFEKGLGYGSKGLENYEKLEQKGIDPKQIKPVKQVVVEQQKGKGKTREVDMSRHIEEVVTEERG